MIRILFSIGLLTTVMTNSVAFAQSAEVFVPVVQLNPIISGPEDVKVGRTLVLDASASTGLGDNTSYRWYVAGISQPISRTVEMVYTPERAGTLAIRLIMSTTVGDEKLEVEVNRDIIVYNRKIALIADGSVTDDKIAIHQQTAEEQNVYLRVIQSAAIGLPVSSEDSLVTAIGEQSTALIGAESIVLWTDGITGLQALMRAIEGDTEKVQGLANQTIIVIANRSLSTLARTARGPFSVLHPNQILVTRKEAINPLLAAESIEGFLTELDQRDIDVVTVDDSSVGLRPWNLLSSLVNYMLTHGVSSQIIILLLSLPVIATILAFLKQVIGVTTFGLYTPSIVALSFLALGWWIGLIFLVLILTTGYATRALMKKWQLLYIPKVAIILTVVSITLLILLGIAAHYDITFGRDTIFVLLIMSTLAESFLNLKTEQGWVSALLGISETILAAMLCVFIVSWAVLKSIILAYPEIILLTFFINAGLGRWTGLRLVEYFRFREVFKHLQEE